MIFCGSRDLQFFAGPSSPNCRRENSGPGGISVRPFLLCQSAARLRIVKRLVATHGFTPCETRGAYDIDASMTLYRSSFSLSSAAPAGVSVAPAHCAGDDQDKDGPGDGQGQVGIATKTKAKPKKPSQYKVLLLNDDYTPMEFVVMILKRFFRMDLEQATRVMLHVHQKGVGVCGVFPYEVAETKVHQVMDFARENQHPLQCTLEKA